METSRAKNCWVVSDGRAGMENQALGLAEAIARQIPTSIDVRRIEIKPPFKKIPTRLWGKAFKRLANPAVLEAKSGVEPDLYIACGRATIPFARAIKARFPGVFTVQCQAPRAPLGWFDLVIPPEHDAIKGTNVFPIIGAPNRVTPEKLTEAGHVLRPAITNLATPVTGVIIGGDSKAYRFSGEGVDRIIARLKELQAAGHSLLIVTSRRTGERNFTALKTALMGQNTVFVDDLPMDLQKFGYFGVLDLADHLLVTEESTNMITDAAATGKQVHLLRLPGGNAKFDRFHEKLADLGITRSLDPENLLGKNYTPLAETDRAAGEVIRRWLG